MKRFVAMILIVGMLCTFAPFVFAESDGFVTRQEAVDAFVTAALGQSAKSEEVVLKQFSDADQIADEYSGTMTVAIREGWTNGYEDGTLCPKEPITRLEALVILSRMLAGRSLPQGAGKEFADVPQWAQKELSRLSHAGMVEGYGNGLLGAEDLLTWEQIEILTRRIAQWTGPRGDYYDYINHAWLKETQIPFGQTAWSDLNAIVKTRMKEIGEIVYSLYRRRYREQVSFPQGSSEQKIVDVFAASSNTAYRDSLGLKPVMEYLSMIDGIRTMQDLLLVMAKLEYNGFHGLFPLTLTTDVYDSLKYILTFSECYTGMNISLVQSEEKERAISAYEAYLTDLLHLFGEEQEEAACRAKKVAMLCPKLAEASMPLERHNDIAEHYHVYDRTMRKKEFQNFDSNAYMKYLGFPVSAELLVYDLPLAKEVDALWQKENLELLKDYLRASVMDGAAVYLNTDAFLVWRGYQDALNGVESGVLPSDYAVSMVEELLSWDLANIYVQRYASKDEKQEVEEITHQILKAYQSRLKENSWMSEESKALALQKLSNLRVRVAYPENLESYLDAEYEIRSTRDGGNLMEYRVNYCNRYFDTAIKRLKNGEKVSKDTWTMLPQTVNALYEPSTNSITIPAGILHAPIYDSNDSMEAKLGSIGAVIAHEVSHALDELGSCFDENGNLTNWWTKEDRIAFQNICEKVEKAYGDMEILPGQYINGKLTLSENLADIASMACVLDIAGEDNPKIEELFCSYAEAWRNKTSEAYLKLHLKTDSHAPDKVRVNRVLANFDVFANYYGITEGDGMYIPPEERIEIW